MVRFHAPHCPSADECVCITVVVEIEEKGQVEGDTKQLRHLDSFSNQTSSEDTEQLILS